MAGRIIGILGSPLPEGNTALLLDRALKGAEDAGCTVEKIVVTNLDFQPCMEMMFCKEHETCIMDDDMQAMYQKFREDGQPYHRNACYDNGGSGKTEILF